MCAAVTAYKTAAPTSHTTSCSSTEGRVQTAPDAFQHKTGTNTNVWRENKSKATLSMSLQEHSPLRPLQDERMVKRRGLQLALGHLLSAPVCHSCYTFGSVSAQGRAFVKEIRAVGSFETVRRKKGKAGLSYPWKTVNSALNTYQAALESHCYFI